jgi:ribonuclease R
MDHDSSPYDDRVLGLVARPDYRPISVKAMHRRLELDLDEYAAFKRAVKALVHARKLHQGKDKKVAARSPDGAGKDEAHALVGTFRRSARGFGFVRLAKTASRQDDIYVPADAALDASTGDQVAVKVLKRARDGQNAEGRVLRVVARASGLFVGTYFEDGGDGYVRVDGTTFHSPLYVGDPGAKGAQPGDKVAVEIVRYPSPAMEGEGVISEVIGPRGQPGVDTLSIIRAYGLPDTFDDDVLAEARHQARLFDEAAADPAAHRLDLRELVTLTIDPATARDFDDAITLERDDRGFFRLGVHIADVSHFVTTGSLLDDAARKRGTSVYLPDRVLPMLPELISNGLASLQEGKDRFTVSALMDFSPEGVRVASQFARTLIRVNHRFAYEQAFAVMQDPDGEHPGLDLQPEVRARLLLMNELARTLRKRRFTRGALELVMPEVEVEIDPEGKVAGAHLAVDDESHQLIEEFMLAANEAVASYLTEHHAAFLRRVHPDPDETKLARFAEFARSLGFPIEDPRSRFELQKVLAASDGTPERQAIHYGLLRSLKQASYTPEAEGHYALASDDYCHFTSPIRRYPDLQVHRQLLALVDGKTPKAKHDELAALGEHCTRTERRAEAAERELVRVKLLTHLESHIGEGFHAVIIGVEDFGFFAQLVELPVEGLVHVTSLGDDYYYLEAETHTLVGRRSGNRFRLGDRLRVRVARVDIDRRELDLTPESPGEEHLPPSRTARRRVPSSAMSRPRPSPRPGPGASPGTPPAPRTGGKRTTGPKMGKGKGKAKGKGPKRSRGR